ncbi:MAG: hypothetical protein GXP27_06850 [Planctomycetes bacterium]|nr:hypothetical protein [Planctomycetota bacterium]
MRQKIDGWASLPLPLRGIAVEKATLNGQPARLGWLAVDEPARAAKLGQDAREAVLQLLHDRAGTAVLELELSAELIRAGSDRTALFSLPPCPSTRMRLLVPAGQRVVLAGGAPARPAPDDRPATYELDLGGLDRVSLLFRPIRQQQRAETLLFARTRYDLDVAPGEVRWQAETTLQVFGKPLENLTAELPAGVEIVSVESPGLASWRRETAAGEQCVQLSFRQSLADAHKVVFRGLLGVTDEQPWHVPALRLPAASGHVGRIVIRSAKGLRLHLREAGRVRQLAPPQSTPRRRRLRSSSETIEAARVQTFHAWSDDFRLTFVTTTKPREIHAAVSTILDVTAKTSGLSLLTDSSELPKPVRSAVRSRCRAAGRLDGRTGARRRPTG